MAATTEFNSSAKYRNKRLPESVNFHITEKCNYNCKFCFAKYKNLKHELTKKEQLRLIDKLVDHGCGKINFAGGEPTLVKHLSNLVNYSNSRGLFVSIISNGTGIYDKFLKKCGDSINLIGLSVDSQFDEIEKKLGRTFKSKNNSIINYSHVESIKKKAKLIHDYGIPLKINSTITQLNWKENMNEFIGGLNPKRWKVFQVHKIHQINDKFFENSGELPNELFMEFVIRHKKLNPIFETSELIKDSYCMITPDGRFYQDTDNIHHYSGNILELNIKHAFEQIMFSQKKFSKRNALYYKQF